MNISNYKEIIFIGANIEQVDMFLPAGFYNKVRDLRHSLMHYDQAVAFLCMNLSQKTKNTSSTSFIPKITAKSDNILDKYLLFSEAFVKSIENCWGRWFTRFP